jgi:solute carrier family 34 (sodium-dependent phosphate cotransporter)
MIGILATVLMQSSSTSTAVVVSLVETHILSVDQGIYMVMGANVGTTITSTIVSFGHFHAPVAAANDKSSRFRRHELDRAFAGATVHDMFNMCTVAVLFPLECATGYLHALTSVLVEGTYATMHLCVKYGVVTSRVRGGDWPVSEGTFWNMR